MNGITHKQAQKYLRAELDGLLTDDQRRDLETHLSGCEACRVEARAFSTLTSRLQSGFRSRWDAQDGPSDHVMKNVRSQTRRIIMSNRISVGLKALGGIAAVLVFGFLINKVVVQMRDRSIVANATQTSAATSPDRRLLAFTSAMENGNLDIYTMQPDGSGLTNLTNNPAHDVNPFWSPDGKRIAFQRNDPLGLMQIFVMNADGSNVIQLTNNEVNHEIMSLNGPWSPDGSRLLFTEWAPNTEKWMLYTVSVDGGNKTPIAEVPNIYTSPSWSPDGKHIAFVKPKPQDGPQEREVSRIYIIDSDGQNLVEATKLVPTDEDILGWNYLWSNDGQSILFVGERYYWENGNGRSALYQVSLDGNSLVEIDHVTTHLDDWWNGTALILPYASSQPSYTWLRPDGTHSILNPYKNCSPSEAQHGLSHKRSINGDLIFGAGCANDDWWFHWANPDGTAIQQLLNYPIHVPQGSVGFFWSPDDKYVVFQASSSDISYLYLVNVADALNDPSIQLVQVPLAGGEQYYNISWQPLP